MNAIKAQITSSFRYKIMPKLKRGTDVLILGKWDGFGASGRGYLIYEPVANYFMELDSGHLDIQNKDKELITYPLPTYSLSGELFLPKDKQEVTYTLGVWSGQNVVVIGTKESESFDSGIGYIIYRQTKSMSKPNALIVDSQEVELTSVGNLIKI